MRESEESQAGQSPFQETTDKSHLMVNNRGTFPETFNSAVSNATASSNLGPWPPTERVIYKPCSEAYPPKQKSLDVKKGRSIRRNLDHDYIVSLWDEEHSPRPGSGICPFGKFLSVAAVISSLASFVCMFYLVVAQRWKKVSLPQHEFLSEGFLLLIQSAVVVTFTSFVALIIIYHGPVSRRLYIGIVSGLLFMCATDQIWFWNELMHSHDYSRTGQEVATFEYEFSHYFSRNRNDGNGNIVPIPSWMHQIQITHNCCGSKGPQDWLTYWNGNDIPDSCCIFPTKGCGIDYFLPEEERLIETSTFIFANGCASSNSRLNFLTYSDILAIQFAKFIESFIMLFLFIVLNACCKQGFVTAQDDGMVPRRARMIRRKPLSPVYLKQNVIHGSTYAM